MTILTDHEISDKQRVLLNLTPRKTLVGLTAFEVFTGSSVTLTASTN